MIYKIFKQMLFIEKLKNGWATLKFIRVGVGIFILISSIQSGLVSGMILGGLFTFISLFTDSICFAGNSCYRPTNKNRNSNIENIDYEELDPE